MDSDVTGLEGYKRDGLTLAYGFTGNVFAGIAAYYWINGDSLTAIIWIFSAFLWPISSWMRSGIAWLNGYNAAMRKYYLDRFDEITGGEFRDK